MSERGDIRDRIDAALEKCAWQKLQVRSINLTEQDRKALDRALTRDFGKPFKVYALGYREHIVRTGTRSAIYSTHGVEVKIPQRLSPRVAAAA